MMAPKAANIFLDDGTTGYAQAGGVRRAGDALNQLADEVEKAMPNDIKRAGAELKPKVPTPEQLAHEIELFSENAFRLMYT
jgi:hypothetical protein